MVSRAALVCIALISVQVYAFRKKTDRSGEKPKCRSLRSHIPSTWCQNNCFVPGKSQVEHPACLEKSGFYHQVCDCEGKAAEPLTMQRDTITMQKPKHCGDTITMQRAGAGRDHHRWEISFGNTKFYEFESDDDTPPLESAWKYNSYSSASREFKQATVIEGWCGGRASATQLDGSECMPLEIEPISTNIPENKCPRHFCVTHGDERIAGDYEEDIDNHMRDSVPRYIKSCSVPVNGSGSGGGGSGAPHGSGGSWSGSGSDGSGAGSGSAEASAQEDDEDGDLSPDGDAADTTCRAHEKCRHLDGDCCPDSAGLMLDCCAASDPEWTPEMWGKGHGQKHDMKGRFEKTKEQGGTRESPSDQLQWFAEALDMIDDHRKAQEIIQSVKNKKDAEDKAKDAMKEYTKDDAKLQKASVREKKAILAAMLREILEKIKDEDQGATEEVVEEADPKKAYSMRHKQKHVELKQGKEEFLKFFEPSSEKAKGALKDDIEVIEPADDAAGTNVDLGKKSLYCSMEDGEVCSIFDEQNNETIKIEKQDWKFLVTRNGTVHDCGAHNTVDTTCSWDTRVGTRYLDFGSALLSADDVQTVDTKGTTDAPNKSSSNQMHLHLVALSVLVAGYAFLV